MNNRDKILHESIKLIGEHGFDAVSIRQITRTVGIRESSFYNHFSSKEGLLLEIFTQMQKDLEAHRPSQEEITKLTSKMDLKEFLDYRLKLFLEGWSNEMARLLWYVVSQQQYKNKQAAGLIVEETEKSIRMFETAFRTLMGSGKMKKGNPAYLAMLYGFSVRAIHLDYTYRQFTEGIEEVDFKRMYQLKEKFAEEHSI
ncbi:MAG: TetR/AcrR family transcriptional regulator [Bacteroidales bacterium]|nr:TetR/AcrR family transcriptional regulator [Bacteroidales bacterium]MCF8397775.1 TetR/AcrR family transcriptional regulator [Bacteroidales bacterium]